MCMNTMFDLSYGIEERGIEKRYRTRTFELYSAYAFAANASRGYQEVFRCFR